MDMITACTAVEAARGKGKTVLVATMGAMSAFDQLGVGMPRLSSVPLMGGAASLGLGLAIARPDLKIIVVDGDASLLMQLGVLTTVADRQPKNLFHIVMNNGTQFTSTGNLATPARNTVDFRGMAAAAGYSQSHRFNDLTALEQNLPSLFAAEGPVFIEIKIKPEQERPGLPPQVELPDGQFTRMGVEAADLSKWLKDA